VNEKVHDTDDAALRAGDTCVHPLIALELVPGAIVHRLALFTPVKAQVRSKEIFPFFTVVGSESPNTQHRLHTVKMYELMPLGNAFGCDRFSESPDR
jgi:hypothetical protein